VLDAKERTLGERRAAWEARDWFTRTGLDWVGLGTGLVLSFLALHRTGWAEGTAIGLAGGFMVGGGIAQLFRAREGRLLAKLYREVKEREAAGR
jgi:hypothetical protein